jgi:hypothetical protein
LQPRPLEKVHFQVIFGGVIFSTYLASATYAAHETFPEGGGPPECFGRECFGGAFLASALCCAGGTAAAVREPRRRNANPQNPKEGPVSHAFSG